MQKGKGKKGSTRSIDLWEIKALEGRTQIWELTCLLCLYKEHHHSSPSQAVKRLRDPHELKWVPTSWAGLGSLIKLTACLENSGLRLGGAAVSLTTVLLPLHIAFLPHHHVGGTLVLLLEGCLCWVLWHHVLCLLWPRGLATLGHRSP